jgi:CheY-like chemotaxis protein
MSADSAPYDVAVIGAQLRDIGIEQFVKELRKKPTAKNVPLIVLTQLGATATLTEVEHEVSAQLAKPLRFSELYDCIVGAFSGKADFQSQPRILAKRHLPRGKKILIVDDNEINRFVATEQVEASGFDVDLAENGRQAVEKIMTNQYAAVLMDCQMPVMDGYTAARTVREWEEGSGKHIPIIALTAHAMAGERDKVLAAGMDDYLSKPLRASALEKMLDRYVDVVTANDEAPKSRERTTPHTDDIRHALDPEVRRSTKLCQLFVDQVPPALTDIERALPGDPTRLRERAHKLKGSCLALGADLMADEAEALQHEAEVGDLSQAPARARRLRELFAEVEGLLAKERGRAESLRPERISVNPH